MSECTIERIFYYPVKGCRAVEADSVELNPTGITGDRGYAILRGDAVANLKSLPTMTKVVVNLVEGGILFQAEGHPDHVHRFHDTGDETSLTFYADQFPILDQGDEVAGWLSSVTGEEVRLVALKENIERNLPLDQLSAAHGVEQDGFCDLSPVMLVNAASLEDVNSQLAEEIPVERFRCNIVVHGLEPYAEDDIDGYQAESFSLTHVIGCERCVIINTDHQSGDMNKEPLKVLNGYRRIEGGYASGILFGNYFNVEGRGALSVGDTMTVVRSPAG